jgi:hypothetical protein
VIFTSFAVSLTKRINYNPVPLLVYYKSDSYYFKLSLRQNVGTILQDLVSKNTGIFIKSLWKPQISARYVLYQHIIFVIIASFVCFWRDSPLWARAFSFTKYLDHTQRRTTVGRTPLDKWSARRRNLYLTTHNTHNIQTSMPPVGFEPTISSGERPETYPWDRAASGAGNYCFLGYT